MSYNTTLAQTAVRIREKIRQFNFNHYDDLSAIMTEFEHMRMRENFVLDAFPEGDLLGSTTRIYAKRIDATDEFIAIIDDSII